MNSNTLLHSQASSTTELISKVHEQNLTLRYTKPDTPLHKTWHSVTQNLTPRYTKPDTPLHKTWHSVTQNLTLRYTKPDTPLHKTTSLDPPSVCTCISINWDLFPSYMNILKYPSIHHMRYVCLSVCLPASSWHLPFVFSISSLLPIIPPQSLF
jgi:hypothetical protein